jgi:hypothetical protein
MNGKALDVGDNGALWGNDFHNMSATPSFAGELIGAESSRISSRGHTLTEVDER